MTLDALRAHLLEHSVKTGDFVLKSGRRSTWFIDSKQTVCRPGGMLLVADAVLSALPDDATAIGGLTMGADPVAFVAAGVAATRGRDLKAFSVRKEAKDHGGGGRVAGALDAGRQGGGDRGHRHPGHVAARGGAAPCAPPAPRWCWHWRWSTGVVPPASCSAGHGVAFRALLGCARPRLRLRRALNPARSVRPLDVTGDRPARSESRAPRTDARAITTPGR